MSAPLSRRVIASTFARSFLIQGSWNYRSMLGGGFAFAMLPVLRRIFTDPGARQEALLRHLEFFNAHPYMSNMALGAAVKLEAEGADPETVRRFKLAVRGPLGSIGDALVWATWLPGVSLLSLTLYWLGLPWWVPVATFLVVYNVGHVGLRLWAFRVGLSDGREVARRLARVDLGGWTERLQGIAAVVLGALVGALLVGREGLAAAGLEWSLAAIVAFVTGLLVGHRTWRPAAMSMVCAIVGLCALGWFR